MNLSEIELKHPILLMQLTNLSNNAALKIISRQDAEQQFESMVSAMDSESQGVLRALFYRMLGVQKLEKSETPVSSYLRNHNRTCGCCGNLDGCEAASRAEKNDLNSLSHEKLLAVLYEQQRQQQSERARQHEAECIRAIATAQQKRRAADLDAMRQRIQEAGSSYP